MPSKKIKIFGIEHDKKDIKFIDNVAYKVEKTNNGKELYKRIRNWKEEDPYPGE